MTQLPPQISELRDAYLAAYRQYLANNSHIDLSPETLILVAGAEHHPEVHRLFRPDAIWRGPDGQPAIARIEPPAPPPFPPTQFLSNDTSVSLHPFPWDDCPISFSRPTAPDLSDWINLHIDRHGQFPPDPAGLHGVIHSVSPPESRGSRHYLHVDLGSAPLSALVSLIDLLTSAGATRVIIGLPNSI